MYKKYVTTQWYSIDCYEDIIEIGDDEYLSIGSDISFWGSSLFDTYEEAKVQLIEELKETLDFVVNLKLI